MPDYESILFLEILDRWWARLREERRFSREVEDRLRRFIHSHSQELQGYSVDTSEQWQ